MTFAEKITEIKKTERIITGAASRKTECFQTGCFQVGNGDDS